MRRRLPLVPLVKFRKERRRLVYPKIRFRKVVHAIPELVLPRVGVTLHYFVWC